MRTSEKTNRLVILKALANPMRLQVLEWLKDPEANFPPQTDGDLVTDGVCSDFIRDKLGLAASTASRHLSVLADAGLLIATRKRGWTFYRRDPIAIRDFARDLEAAL